MIDIMWCVTKINILVEINNSVVDNNCFFIIHKIKKVNFSEIPTKINVLKIVID